MNIKQAKEYYELGILTEFYAVRGPLTPRGWLLVVARTDERNWTLKTALGKDKVFASLDTLIGEVEEISGRVSSLTIRSES